MTGQTLNVGQIIDRLSETSSRPRYAFMVLNLLAEQANDLGYAGPFVRDGSEELRLRDWIGLRLSRMSGRDRRRKDLEARIRARLKDELPEDMFEAQTIVDKAVIEHTQSTGADNFSRVITELEKSGLLTRHYAGYRTNHRNRGGLRNLVCVINGDAIAALRRRDLLV